MQGDPPASGARFRGYGDPSLELDPVTGTLWLAYSWLDTRVWDAGPPATVDFIVVTHLARSDDGGRSFRFVRAVNAIDRTRVPERPGLDGVFEHEVASLVREGPDAWQLLWIDYFDPLGDGPRDPSHFHYVRSAAREPARLGDTTQPWMRGSGTPTSIGARFDVSATSGLQDCFAVTEPALFRHGGETWLATSCLVFEGVTRRVDRDRLVLLRQTEDGYELVGTLLDHADAQRMGADRLEQADLAVARDGSVILTVTPIRDRPEPMHQGCVVGEVEDLARARVRRDASGAPVRRVTLTAYGTGIGPGLCSYDAASATGMLLVITDIDPSASPPRFVFSLRATGVHP